MKICLKCNNEFPLTSFCKDSKRKDGLSPYCETCRKDYYKIVSKRSYAKTKDKRNARVKERAGTVDGRIKRMLVSARSRAKIENLPFNIEYSDIIIPEVCPLLGIKLTLEVNPSAKNNACESTVSLDKIVPELGYIKGNIRVISYLANRIKGDVSKELLMTFANNIGTYFE